MACLRTAVRPREAANDDLEEPHASTSAGPAGRLEMLSRSLSAVDGTRTRCRAGHWPNIGDRESASSVSLFRGVACEYRRHGLTVRPLQQSPSPRPSRTKHLFSSPTRVPNPLAELFSTHKPAADHRATRQPAHRSPPSAQHRHQSCGVAVRATSTRRGQEPLCFPG